jgi:DNA-directed RNA polymerase specialized sigma24 family protein
MNAESEPVKIVPVTEGEAANYATAEEVVSAISALTDEHYAKLMLIAGSFCKRRQFTPSVMEPGDLFGEAITKTLQLAKKWNKRISIVRHLDRAMENISGHLVRGRKNIVPFPDGLEPSAEQRGEPPVVQGADEVLMTKEEINAHLVDIFGNDTEAARIFCLRAEGFQAADIQQNLNITPQKYEAVAKRIRRKIALALNQKK